MNNKIYISTLLSVFVLSFSACGGGSSDTTTTDALEDINLSPAQYVICTDETSFTVTPSSENPNVTFTQDVESGEVTIVVDANTSGSVTVTNCTQN